MTFLRAAVALLLLISPLHAQPTPSATDAWALTSGDTAAVFATINNPSMYDLYVVSGKSESGASVEFAEGNKTITSITVPAYGSVQLMPGTQRIRVLGLKQPLKEGDELKLTLETDGGVGIPIAAIVKATNP